VKPSVLRLAVLVALAAGASFVPAQKEDPSRSAPPTTPRWLKFVDQGASDPRLKGYRTPEGVKLEIVAEAPTVINPVGMAFADDGRPFVIEWLPSPGDEERQTTETFKYRDGRLRTMTVRKKRVKDVVKVLSHGDAKSTYDKARVVLEDEFPANILFHDGWLYLSGRGTVKWLLRLLEEEDTALRESAVRALGTTPAGAKRVARRFLDGKLPRDLRADVVESLRKHAARDTEAASLLSDVMKR
jgi:quinoprotein glucose dehydrogenase